MLVSHLFILTSFQRLNETTLYISGADCLCDAYARQKGAILMDALALKTSLQHFASIRIKLACV
jgi:hypothetical protein